MAKPLRRFNINREVKKQFPDDERRQEVYRRILEWFPKDVLSKREGDYYEYNDKHGNRVRQQRHVTHKANRKTVVPNVRNLDELDIDLILGMDREQFRAMASVNPLYWYH